jgi:GNAT superfamily N-acetyltransferase
MTGPDRRLARVNDDPAAFREAYDLLRAAYLHDDPQFPFPQHDELVAVARNAQTARRNEFWLLRADGRPVGCCRAMLPTLDNVELAEIDLGVAPEHQGQGHGRALFGLVVDELRRLGRHQVVVGIGEPPDGTTSRSVRFAAAAGLRRSLAEARRTLDLTSLDTARLDGLRKEAADAAEGYELLGWTGSCPDELVDGYARLVARMSTDAPMGDLDIEPEVWDGARIREREALFRAQGRTQIATVARRVSDGELAGFTDLGVTVHDPENAFQWDTLVRREDRGHRLGLLVKLANLDRLLAEAPQVRRVHTWNADSNTWMVAINEAMGFRVARHEAVWRLDLSREEHDA